MRLRKLILLTGILPVVLAASVLAACGGDDDDDDDSGGGGGTGSDQKYVADICKAGANFSKDIAKLEDDLKNVSDFDEIAKKMAGPVGDFAKAFSKANPPKDLKDWHEETADNLNDAAKSLKDGNFAAFEGVGEAANPPQAAQDRLQKIADGNKDCSESEFAFGS